VYVSWCQEEGFQLFLKRPKWDPGCGYGWFGEALMTEFKQDEFPALLDWDVPDCPTLWRVGNSDRLWGIRALEEIK
jgi:hypothetical protein